MKKLMCATVLLCLLAAGFVARAEDSVNLLVYMCGSGLEEAACADLNEMMDAYTGNHVMTMVMAGGVSSWPDEVLTGGVNSVITLADGSVSDIEEVGTNSMGDPETLADFLSQGMRANDADRNIVVLWNHGMGSAAGMCFDDNADGDGLTLNEIGDALDQLERDVPGCHIDLLCCDACMMGSYEVAALLSQHSIDYFLASEEVEPGLGFFYTPWMSALEEDPGMPTEALCASIIDSAMEDFQAYMPDEPVTLSAIDLRKMPELVESVESFAVQMTSAITGGQLSAVKRGRSRLYSFGSYCSDSWDMVDMAAAFRAYEGIAPESVERAQRALEAAVVISKQTEDLDACCGLSILIPQDTCDVFEAFFEGFDLSRFLPNWMAFVQRYVEILNGTSYSFGELCPIQIVPGATISGQTTTPLQRDTLVATGGGDTAQPSERDTLLPAGEQVDYTVQETDYGFYMQLTSTDMENLDYVEGMLMLDASDDEMYAYVDLGSMRENVIDWKAGEVYSLFDGSWYLLGDQLVALYDQTVTEKQRRSLIPIKLNGSDTYLVVVFPSGDNVGRIVGTNAGYSEDGLPIRETRKLVPGDRIVPVFTMYYQMTDDDGEEMEETEFEGEEIIWNDDLSVTRESLVDDGSWKMKFCFALNDIFGDYELSEMVDFEL